jgi:hypothetical protein
MASGRAAMKKHPAGFPPEGKVVHEKPQPGADVFDLIEQTAGHQSVIGGGRFMAAASAFPHEAVHAGTGSCGPSSAMYEKHGDILFRPVRGKDVYCSADGRRVVKIKRSKRKHLEFRLSSARGMESINIVSVTLPSMRLQCSL